MLPILGSLDVASLVPATYRASTSLVLQTVLLAAGLYIFGKLVTFIRWHRRTDKLFGNVPGPKERHWLFGSFRNMPEDGHDRMQVFVDWGNQYARAQGYLRLWGSFWRPVIVACHPTSMKKILKTAEPKPLGLTSGYRTLKAWLGDGLLISGGEKWARNRRLLTPAFHFDILKPYIHVYNDAAGIFVDKLNDFAARGEQFELFQHVKPWLASDIIFYNTALGKKYKRDCDYVHGVAEDIINTRKAALEKIGGVDKKKYLDFLDILLTAKDENGVGLSYMDIRNEVDTFLFEGHDTTASAISWILYSLAEHPEYQQKCQEEVDEVLQGRQDVEWSDLPKLEYLTQCIKEGMRLHAPVAIVGRETTKPFPIADIVCPPGTNVMINIWMLHHNVEVWGEDHMDFRPDRFTKEACAKMDPYQYVPFSGGPSFTFNLVPGHVVRRRLAAVMRAENGIMMTVERRKH
ncbi:CP4FE-like protein [Mya arenaria]|uniref:CP4FE-like protein n=1 Tax=Mya arenaria TaxID=6604 RepID=A0ABY7DIE0_MYAAR|nr:CP4FE-like protein [Mya arenaria]